MTGKHRMRCWCWAVPVHGVNVAGGPWVNHGAVVLDGASYLQYTLGSATLYLDPDVILL